MDDLMSGVYIDGRDYCFFACTDCCFPPSSFPVEVVVAGTACMSRTHRLLSPQVEAI